MSAKRANKHRNYSGAGGIASN